MSQTKRLIIGCGGTIIFSFIGVLKKLGPLENLEEISCSSTGSIIGLFYVFTRGDVDKMLQMALDAPLEKMAHIDVKGFLTRFGLINTRNFEKYIDSLCSLTFKELYEHNPIKLHVASYNLMTDKTIYMSVDTTPDMKVSHAVRRSISVPLVMIPCFVPSEGGVFVDGSFAEVSPYQVFLGKTDVLEIRYIPSPKPKKIPRTLVEYVYTVVFSFINYRMEYNDFPRIDVESDITVLDFSLSTEKKMELYIKGCGGGMYGYVS
jgi:predicted acylesterase/phospholipase RssA